MNHEVCAWAEKVLVIKKTGGSSSLMMILLTEFQPVKALKMP